MKIKITAELVVDGDVYSFFGNDEESKWFRNEVLFGNDLIVHSNQVGDTVGPIKILKIEMVSD